MAVAYSEPMGGSRSGSVNARWERNYTVVYKAQTDHPRVGANAVLAACPVAIGASYASGLAGPPVTTEADAGAYVQSISASCSSEDSTQWDVTVEYGPTAPLEENPLGRTPRVSWDFLTEERIVDIDRDGRAVVNAAYDPFDPPLVADKHPAAVVVTRNEATFPYDLVNALQDGTNLADFLFAGDVGLWRIAKITGDSDEVTLSGGTVVAFWAVRYELHFQPDGWGRSLLNQGMRALNAAGTAWVPILMQGQPISSPALLAADGQALAAAGTPIYLDFRVYPAVDYGLLNFTGIDFGQGPLP